MFSGGNVILAVADLDAAARFYTHQLGLALTHRFGTRWVTVDAGPSYWSERNAGLVLGLQPHAGDLPAPGTQGAVGFGLETSDPLESLVAHVSARGVRFSGDIVSFEAGKCIALEDAERNGTYLWEVTEDMHRGTGGRMVAEPPSITGGHALVFVSDMDRAVRYYSEVLGLPLTNRYENKIATVEAGRTLVIALHPTSPSYPPPGTRGAARIVLHVDEPIDRVLSRLVDRGVRVVGGASNAREQGSVVIADADGNVIEIVEARAIRPTLEEEGSLAPAAHLAGGSP